MGPNRHRMEQPATGNCAVRHFSNTGLCSLSGIDMINGPETSAHHSDRRQTAGKSCMSRFCCWIKTFWATTPGRVRRPCDRGSWKSRAGIAVPVNPPIAECSPYFHIGLPRRSHISRGIWLPQVGIDRSQAWIVRKGRILADITYQPRVYRRANSTSFGLLCVISIDFAGQYFQVR